MDILNLCLEISLALLIVGPGLWGAWRMAKHFNAIDGAIAPRDGSRNADEQATDTVEGDGDFADWAGSVLSGLG